MRGSQKGFTLIELLVVISIIGILASMAVVSVNKAREKGADVKAKADVRNLSTAIELYFDAKNQYPVISTTGCPEGWNLSNCPAVLATEGYVSALPSVPASPGVVYTYNYSAASSTYELKSMKTFQGVTSELMKCTEKGC